MNKNGYVYIYACPSGAKQRRVSNETPNIDVYFDNLQAVSPDHEVRLDDAYKGKFAGGESLLSVWAYYARNIF